MSFKRLLQKIALKFGYDLKKAHPEAYNGVAVLDLLDLGVREMMRRQGPSLKFVQIGANDGITGDPIRPYILEYGWEGILVEPQIRVFERLKENYRSVPRLKFENCAIASKDGTSKFYTVCEQSEDGVMGETLASFDRAPLERHARGRKASVEELTVATMTPTSLLEKHQFGTFDLLQIDAEGYDFELLKMFDLGDTGPPLIHFESGQMKASHQAECYRFLSRMDYAMLTLKGDTLAMKN
jgi:FkbM family methyltransferase